MAAHGSATVREEKPHANQTTRTKTILNALTRRAQAVLSDKSIDAESRAIIRYGMEVNDPWLADLVRRVGERGAVRRLEDRMTAVDQKLDRMALRSELVELKDQVAHLTERIAQLEKALN